MHGTADPDYWGSNPHLPLPNWVRKYLNKDTFFYTNASEYPS